MKMIFTFFCCALTAVQAQDVELPVKSKIKNVTVFLQGAQITRQAKVPLKTGVALLKLPGIAAGIQEQSIQVESSSDIKILTVSFRVNYLDEKKKPEKIAALETERRRIMTLVTEERSKEDVYKEEEAILKTNKSIGGTARGVDIEELKVAMDYFRERLKDIKQLQLQADRNIRRYNEELGKIEAQLTELSNQRSLPSGEIVIRVSSKKEMQADLSVKYLVKEAGWYPSYDIRAKDIQSPVAITYKANVSQQSGEDWENVTLTISSANPSVVGAKPVLKPWHLGFNNKVASLYTPTIGTVQQDRGVQASNNFTRGRVVDQDGNGLPGVNVVIKGTTVGTVSDAEGYYSIPLTADAKTLTFSFVGYQSQDVFLDGKDVVDVSMSEDVKELSEVVVTGYGVQRKSYMTGSVSTVYNSLNGRVAGVTIQPKVKKTIVATPVVRQTNVEFTIDEPFSITSDGEVRSTDMVEYELEASYEYYCAPKLDTDAFLIAQVLHWDEYNFLEGEASLFFEGKYIGKSILDTRNMSDTLTLSLGRDANVLVTREKIKEMSSRQFVGSNQKVSMAYEIQIRNKKAQSINVTLEDQIPVPNDKEIDVDRVEDSRATYDNETGLVKWRKEIPSGKSELIRLVYSVKYPKNTRMMLE